MYYLVNRTKSQNDLWHDMFTLLVLNYYYCIINNAKETVLSGLLPAKSLGGEQRNLQHVEQAADN